MTSDLGQETLTRIQTALALHSRPDTVHDVKQAVIDEFEHVDSKVRIHATEYFRHSYAPDLVLRWPDDVDRGERWVYLRSKVEPTSLLEDVAIVARDQPIIFGLVPTTSSTGTVTLEQAGEPAVDSDLPAGTVAQLRQRSTSVGTLITDPQGLDALVPPDNASGSSIQNLVARQILRGGRGVYDEAASTETTAAINAGFEAAFTSGAEATSVAAAKIRENLGEQSGERLLRLLHAIWVGSGGRSDLFPDAPTASGPLSDDALELLVAGPEIDNPKFWERLGDFNLPQLGRLNVGDRPLNLGRLISANIDKIEGRWCRVRADQPRADHSPVLKWGIEKGSVALHGSNFSAYLALEKPHLDPIPVVLQDGIGFDELAQRSEVAEAEIADFTGAGGGLIIGVAADGQGDVMKNPNTQSSVGAAAENLTRATATLRNGHVVNCDFATTTASSRTRSVLTVRELVRHGLPLVWPLAEGDMAQLIDLIGPVAALEPSTSMPGQASLFDDLEDEPTEAG